jgi:hypothetical protein
MKLSTTREATGCAGTEELPKNFMKPESLAPHSQELTTVPYPESDRSSTHLPIFSFQYPSQYFSTHLRHFLSSGFFPSRFPTNNLYAFLSSPMRPTFPVHLIPCWLNYFNYTWRRAQVM